MDSHKVISPPTKLDLLLLRSLILFGLIAIFFFLYWLTDLDHIGNRWLFGFLSVGIAFKLLRLIFEWYYYVSIQAPSFPKKTREWSVDMLTTYVPGEPYDMIENTLKAMVAVRYPHTTYLCDEGNDSYLKKLCEDLGVIHVYRGEIKRDAKAGNINYALTHHATGEIAIILDPDHIPIPSFIDQVLPYFEDPQIGYVQSIQAYSNRNESFIAKGAAEQTYMFYGPIMMGMNRLGTAQAIGANCAFRRAALNEIGGHAAGLCEDMHTSMQLHAKKWKSVYIPEQLTRGLVPSTLSAYYKQQLKWARGSFELLFEVLPSLFKKFTVWQKIHYTIAPLYYLFGLVGLIDFLIPILALLTFEVPLHINFQDFFFHVAPLLLAALFIRQYAQRFVLEEHERGFHFLGGALRVATWWIYLLGFIYAICNIKVPYIPTPKEGHRQNEFRLSLPNLGIVLLSIVSIAIGLNIDWSPYTWLMGSFALANVTVLSVILLAAQQKWLEKFYDNLYHGKYVLWRRKWYALRHYGIYRLFRNKFMVPSVLAVLVGSFATSQLFLQSNTASISSNRFKDSGQVFAGVEGSPVYNFTTAPSEINASSSLFHRKLDLFPSQLDTTELIKTLNICLNKQMVPFIELKFIPQSSVDTLDTVFYQIYSGQYDTALQAVMALIDLYPHAVLLNWNIAESPICRMHKNEQTYAYQARAWEYIASQFKLYGISSVAWVWNEDHRKGVKRLVDNATIDYFAISTDPYQAKNASQLFHTDSLISNLIGCIEQYKKPILLTEVDISKVEVNRLLAQKSYSDESEVLPLIQGWLFQSDTQAVSSLDQPLQDQNIESYIRPVQLDISMSDTSEVLSLKQLREFNPACSPTERILQTYIKGIAYNPAHSWRDGHRPLTKRILERDFQLIKDMGANTIRRYNPTIYDKNILNQARKYDLKVMYGFWFSPQKDYELETVRNEYMSQIQSYVESYKSDSTISMWVIGNETWGGLKHHFAQPKLQSVRMAYLGMLQEMVQWIHQQDPVRPVISAIEFSPDIQAALKQYTLLVPELDAIGVNVYYESHFKHLRSYMDAHYPGKPYLITEYGPKGYWDTNLTDIYQRDRVQEQTSFEKARMYANHWNRFIKEHADRNWGGVAYSWYDRMEATSTWYGITDYKGRLKPTYYALKNVWTNSRDTFPLSDVWLGDITSRLKIEDGLLKYKAITPNNARKDLTYEWKLQKDEYLDVVSDVVIPRNLGKNVLKAQEEYHQRFSTTFPSAMGKEFYLHLPIEEEGLRIYLYISDDRDHVITASIPVILPK